MSQRKIMSKQISPKVVSLTFGVLVLLFLTAFYITAVWEEPTTSPPGGDAQPPVNIGSDLQTKTGGLFLGSLGVEGGTVLGSSMPSSTTTLEVTGWITADAVTVKGGVALPTCDSSVRGQLFLVQDATDDVLYVCRNISSTYNWVAL